METKFHTEMNSGDRYRVALTRTVGRCEAGLCPAWQTHCVLRGAEVCGSEMLGTVGCGNVRPGETGQGKHTFSQGGTQFARRGNIRHGDAMLCAARLGAAQQTHAFSRGGAVCHERQCSAGCGVVRICLANTLRLTGRRSLRGLALRCGVRMCDALSGSVWPGVANTRSLKGERSLR
jgi:hypothetical protein